MVCFIRKSDDCAEHDLEVRAKEEAETGRQAERQRGREEVTQRSRDTQGRFLCPRIAPATQSTSSGLTDVAHDDGGHGAVGVEHLRTVVGTPLEGGHQRLALVVRPVQRQRPRLEARTQAATTAAGIPRERTRLRRSGQVCRRACLHLVAKVIMIRVRRHRLARGGRQKENYVEGRKTAEGGCGWTARVLYTVVGIEREGYLSIPPPEHTPSSQPFTDFTRE